MAPVSKAIFTIPVSMGGHEVPAHKGHLPDTDQEKPYPQGSDEKKSFRHREIEKTHEEISEGFQHPLAYPVEHPLRKVPASVPAKEKPGKQRDHRNGDYIGGEQGQDEHRGQLPENLLHIAPDEEYGHQDGHGGDGAGEVGQHDLPGAVHRGPKGRLAQVMMAIDVLNHHDGVVKKKPHG
nr:hypothetical protein [Thermosulfurimonas sp. F29]